MKCNTGMKLVNPMSSRWIFHTFKCLEKINLQEKMITRLCFFYLQVWKIQFIVKWPKYVITRSILWIVVFEFDFNVSYKNLAKKMSVEIIMLKFIIYELWINFERLLRHSSSQTLNPHGIFLRNRNRWSRSLELKICRIFCI